MQRRDAPVQVLCPLQYEARMLSRRLSPQQFKIECIGPGADSVAAWFQRLERPAGQVAQPFIVLAGLAGALSDQFIPGEAYVVGRVVSPDGALIGTAGPRGDRRDPVNVTVTSVESTVRSRSEREVLRQQSGADLVDLESVAFVQLATQGDVSWMIVRGVSDGVADELPIDIDQWVNQRGQVRVWTVIGNLVSHPVASRKVIRLSAQSRNALDSVARCLQNLSRSEAMNAGPG